MKKITLLFVLFCINMFSQDYEQNGYLGNEFIFSIAPSDTDNGVPPTGLHLFLTSIEETQAYINYKGQTIPISLKANSTEDIELTQYFGNNIELRESHVSSDNSFHIESSKPMFASFVNFRTANSEGFTLIPIEQWGQFYVHNSYYDFNEVRNYKSGFIVIASEDRTRITIELKGEGNSQTDFDNKIGDTIVKTLNRGSTFMVRGDGTTKGIFDLSGSQIRADKPIGVISFHERTIVPSTLTNNGRDHLVEMMPPAKSLDMEHFVLQFDRGTNEGDLFRVVAVEDMTYFEVRYFDIENSEYIGMWDGVLSKAGDFKENKYKKNGEESNVNVRGLVYIKSNKPVLVSQYSNSQALDMNEYNYDPFMVTIPPVTQYSKSSIFTFPKSNNTFTFSKNLNLFLNLEKVELENVNSTLEELKINNKFIFKEKPELLANVMPFYVSNSTYQNKIFWLQLSGELAEEFLLDGTNSISSDSVKFYGIAYGSAGFNSYGYPIARSFEEIHPTLKVEDNEDDINIVLFPNPANNYIELSSELGFISEFSIVDLEGKLIREGKYEDKIYVGDLSKGIYLVRCKIDNQFYDKKLIVER